MEIRNQCILLSLYFSLFYQIQLVNCSRASLYANTKSPKLNQTFKNVHNVSKSTGPLLQSLDTQLSNCGATPIDIREVTILQVQKYFQTSQLSSVGLTACYLNRIAKMNPHLKAVIQTNDNAIRVAFKMDLERMLGIIRGPLHGIPILIKDNIDTVDTTQTTAGAIAMQLVLPKRDAEVVRRLKSAGAVILGKTNPSEWAYFRGSDEPSGWSGRGGQTLSPYLLTSDPSGSSTGSAVGIAANLAVVALGTETDGSIISPSSRNSLVGLKTTLNSVSTKGVIPIGFSQDVVGPMTRTVSDNAILLSIISNVNLEGCEKSLKHCLSHQNFKIGIVREPFWNASDYILKQIIPDLELALDSLKDTGRVTIIDKLSGNATLLKSLTSEAENTVLRHEFKHGINQYLERDVDHFEFIIDRKIRRLSDIIQFNIDNPPKEGYNQNQLIASEKTDGLNNQTYIRLRDQNKQNSQGYILNLLDGNNLDVIATPCDSSDTATIYSIGAIAGYPSITVPVGSTDEGIQFGICFLGRPDSEAVLLKIAYLLEKVYVGREMPGFQS